MESLDHVINDKHRLAVFVNSQRALCGITARSAGLRAGIPEARPAISRCAGHLGNDGPCDSEDLDCISPTLLNHFGFGYNRLKDSNSSVTLDQGWPGKIGLDGVAETTFPLISFTGTSYQGGTLNQLGRNNAGVEPNGSYIVQNDTTWIHGKHNVRFGVEVRKYYYDQDYRGRHVGWIYFQP